ncbi:hypothetical protein [Actinomyces capricornis]|uniref:Helix-turn-helix domain-containing protein n=1 Tax=Actinomyces capricornis TaxID=2755559 RepID=A0ABM7U7X3_9ACTO|nr:hypothetical protein [Actinomyces capricornis]BDA63558.1 hypothetical protein MANAM107_03920 [Actinomyces capricornis]
MRVDVTSEEREVLLRWKKRNDMLILVRLKSEAVLYASRGVDTGIISEMVDRTARTVREWLSDWRRSRLCSVVSGHAGNGLPGVSRTVGENVVPFDPIG